METHAEREIVCACQEVLTLLAAMTPPALGSPKTMTTTPDPNRDPALVGEAPATADDGSTSTEQLLEDAEGAIAASTLDAPDT
jgi:hypothetical protein